MQCVEILLNVSLQERKNFFSSQFPSELALYCNASWQQASLPSDQGETRLPFPLLLLVRAHVSDLALPKVCVEEVKG